MPKFRLLQGKHSQKELVVDDKGNPIFDEDGKPKMVNVLYEANDVIETDTDLIDRFPSAALQKFELISKEGRRCARTQNGHKFSGGKVIMDKMPKDVLEKMKDALIRNTPEKEKPDTSGTVQAAMDHTLASKPFTQAKSELPSQASQFTREALEHFSLKELGEIAAAEEVDLKGATRKDDMIKMLVAAKGKK